MNITAEASSMAEQISEDLKKQIDSKQSDFKFIKTGDLPAKGLSDAQRVALVRKANALFNDGDLAMAERIFIATGYSDGLTRIGDKYAQKNEYMDALKMYLLAHNKRKSEPIVEKIAQTVSLLLSQED